ncbi:hypothetical protein MAP00_003686 [Monascus purpureus]|nr:hypothetical protein MAP00_003686 [Monascus purpureus]
MGTLQVFIKNRAGFLSMWLFLRLVETGYIPGAMFTLSTWYKNEELAKRVAYFFFGMFSGNALSPLLASGVLQLDGHRGIRGWRWLFIIEGIFTIFFSFLFLLFLPGSPDFHRPILSPGLLRFSEPEREILRERLQRLDDGYPEKDHHSKIPLRVVWKAVLYYRRWLHYLSTFAVFSTWSPLTTYTPSIMMSLGFDRTTANDLAAVGGLLELVVVFGFAYIGDLSNVRGVVLSLSL